jgi:hypothetical protein
MIWFIFLALFTPPTDAVETIKDVKWDAIGVARCVNNYITGTMTGNKDQIRRAFLANAGLQLIREGEHKRYPLDTYVGFFKEGKSYDRPGRIVSADITGNAAMVKVEIHMGDKRYTDYLILLKVGDDWKIAEKIAFNAPKDEL